MLKMSRILVAVTLLIATGAHAQAPQGPPSAGQMVSFLTAKLNLTEEQQHAIAPVIEERQAKLRALRDADPGSLQRRREARAIVAAGDRQIKAVLSPEQQRQYADMERELIERLREQRGQAQ